MDETSNKTIERLVKAIEAAYNSPGKMFWRGFLLGLGRGIGNLIGWLLLLAILVYLFKASGLDKTFQELLETFRKASGSLQNLPFR